MRKTGFSTGALAKGDFRRGVDILKGRGITSVELCALRTSELEPLIDALDSLELERFSYVSFHAPSKFEASEELSIVRQLRKIFDRGWNIIVHPDSITDFSAWGD